MTTQANKDLFRYLVGEVFNGRKLEVVDEIVAEDAIDHELPPGAPEGREAVRWFVQTFAAAFPDWQATIEDLLAEGDKVIARQTWTGTHLGEFMGLPATGKRFEVGVIDIVRFRDGKMVEHWGQTDNLGLMQQLGAIPETDTAGI